MRDSVAVQSGQTTEFIWSNPINFKVNRKEKNQNIMFVNYELDEFFYLLAVTNSAHDKGNAFQSLIALYQFSFYSIQVELKRWDNRRFFLKLNPNLRLYQALLASPKFSLEKRARKSIEMQQLLNVQNTDFIEETFCLEWIMFNGRKKFLKTSALIQTSWTLSCNFAETSFNSDMMKLDWKL